MNCKIQNLKIWWRHHLMTSSKLPKWPKFCTFLMTSSLYNNFLTQTSFLWQSTYSILSKKVIITHIWYLNNFKQIFEINLKFGHFLWFFAKKVLTSSKIGIRANFSLCFGKIWICSSFGVSFSFLGSFLKILDWEGGNFTPSHPFNVHQKAHPE